MSRLDVLFEDNHLLVVNKPPGLATMGSDGEPTLHSLACDYLRHKYNKPGNVYVGIVSRLDTVTSGVIVMARTSKSASRLVPQFARAAGKAAATKLYLAIVEGVLEQAAGTLRHDVYKDDAAHRMRVATAHQQAATQTATQVAELSYVTLDRGASQTLVAVRLGTGRKHQIRLQFSHLGHPVLGDRKYGSKREFGSRVANVAKVPEVALHSWRLQIMHPTLQRPLAFGVQPPKTWNHTGEVTVPDEVSNEICESLSLPQFVPLSS